MFTCWHACYFDDDWRCHAWTGPGHMTNHEIFFVIKLISPSFCISTCLDYDPLEHYGANAQNTYRRIYKLYCSRPVHAKRCYWAVILERIESRTLESHEILECLVCLVCQVCQCLSWKTHTRSKKQNLKSESKLHISYVSETEEQNSNGCKLLVKKEVKFPYSPILLQNKSVFPMEMYCFCHCFLYSRTECIM